MTSDRPPAEIADVDERLISRLSGGLIVDMGVRAFVPISQVAELRRDELQATAGGDQAAADELTMRRLQEMIGRKLPVKVIELNRPRNRLIVSERAAMQERRGQRKEAGHAPVHDRTVLCRSRPDRPGDDGNGQAGK